MVLARTAMLVRFIVLCDVLPVSVECRFRV